MWEEIKKKNKDEEEKKKFFFFFFFFFGQYKNKCYVMVLLVANDFVFSFMWLRDMDQTR